MHVVLRRICKAKQQNNINTSRNKIFPYYKDCICVHATTLNGVAIDELSRSQSFKNAKNM